MSADLDQLSSTPPQTPVAGAKPRFGQRPVAPGELPLIMRKHILTATFGNAWGNLITGIIFIYFGNAIGMTQLQWGLLSGIGSWMVAAQPFGALFAERIGTRRLAWFWPALGERILRMLTIIGAYLMWRAGHPGAYLLLMTGTCVAALSGNFANAPWFGWLATIIPKDVQGAFWGRRDSWISVVVIAVSLPSGFIMDLIPESGKLEATVLILIFASLLGFSDLLIHQTIPEPPFEPSRKKNLLEEILKPLRDTKFRPWLLFTASWNFGMSLGGSLCTLYFMENLGFKNNLLGGMFALNVVGLVGTSLAARRMGRMVDRFGIRRMLSLGYSFWSLLPGIWLFASPRSAVLVIGLASLVGGMFPVAANNAGVKLVTRFPAPQEAAIYMAVSTMVGSFCGGVGAIAAGTFLGIIGTWSFTVLGLVVSGFPVLFMISFALRLTSTIVLIPRIRPKGTLPEQEQPFMLPMFFESLPGINRGMRGRIAGSGARRPNHPSEDRGPTPPRS